MPLFGTKTLIFQIPPEVRCLIGMYLGSNYLLTRCLEGHGDWLQNGSLKSMCLPDVLWMDYLPTLGEIYKSIWLHIEGGI